MARWLSNLRKKPKHVRDNIAFGSSLGLTVVIALVWFINGGSTHLANNNSTKNGSDFFKTFKEGLGKQMAAAQDSIPKSSTSTATSTDRSNFQATPFVAATSTGAEQKPVLIEVVHSSSTASSSSSTSSY